MSDIENSQLNYPIGAAQVRDLIKAMIGTQVDHGSSMDTGGGFGQADLWVKFGGVEYLVLVKGPSADRPLTSDFR